jgi:small subunit ribosomal protein S18
MEKLMRRSPAKKPQGTRPGGIPQLKVFNRPRRTCPFSGPKALKIDYKDVRLLSRFVTERGRIMPRRITFVSMKAQRQLAAAVKRARFLALMPYVAR